MNLYFIFNFDHGFMIYIYIYIYIYIILIFSSLVFFFLSMTSVYLFKDFNFISDYDGLFSNFNCYKCLCSNASKHLKIIHKRFLKYAYKYK